LELKLLLEAASLAVSIGVVVAAGLSFYTRNVAEVSTHRKLDELGTRLIARIDGVRDDVANLSTNMRVAEERHANLAWRMDRLDRVESPHVAQTRAS
jgi:predicted DNA-binding ribbon-helix-helix protein